MHKPCHNAFSLSQAWLPRPRQRTSASLGFPGPEEGSRLAGRVHSPLGCLLPRGPPCRPQLWPTSSRRPRGPIHHWQGQDVGRQGCRLTAVATPLPSTARCFLSTEAREHLGLASQPKAQLSPPHCATTHELRPFLSPRCPPSRIRRLDKIMSDTAFPNTVPMLIINTHTAPHSAKTLHSGLTRAPKDRNCCGG